MRANNLTLLTDLYELTMMQGYFKNPTNQTVSYTHLDVYKRQILSLSFAFAPLLDLGQADKIIRFAT